jgi:hypothetical protein
LGRTFICGTAEVIRGTAEGVNQFRPSLVNIDLQMDFPLFWLNHLDD